MSTKAETIIAVAIVTAMKTARKVKGAPVRDFAVGGEVEGKWIMGAGCARHKLEKQVRENTQALW